MGLGRSGLPWLRTFGLRRFLTNSGTPRYYDEPVVGHRWPGRKERPIKSEPDMETPRIVGIVNITEDSFSDGGKFLSAPEAIAQSKKLLADGAEIIDLGPAASNPDSKLVGAKEEIRRLDPVISFLKSAGATISVVKRPAILTPDRRPILTPLDREFVSH
jgi:Pterin binding enzyme